MINTGMGTTNVKMVVKGENAEWQEIGGFQNAKLTVGTPRQSGKTRSLYPGFGYDGFSGEVTIERLLLPITLTARGKKHFKNVRLDHSKVYTIEEAEDKLKKVRV